MNDKQEMTMRERFFIPPMIFAFVSFVLEGEYQDLSDKSFTSWGRWLFLALSVVSLAWATYYWWSTRIPANEKEQP